LKIDYKQMKFIDPLLILIVSEFEEEYGCKVVTSLYRIGDSGVHGTLPLRGIDIREKNQTIGHAMEEWINSRWIYDPKRSNKKVCVYHDTGSGYHLHCQVHPDTIRN